MPNDNFADPKFQQAQTKKRCGRMMVGCGPDFYDPICTLPKGHRGVCLSTAADGNYHTDIDAELAIKKDE